jgi:hypothetical protein
MVWLWRVISTVTWDRSGHGPLTSQFPSPSDAHQVADQRRETRSSSISYRPASSLDDLSEPPVPGARSSP